jgi:alpha-D-ribose 1-methylphosphonate 5-triphosphate synthase subunit PhnG
MELTGRDKDGKSQRAIFVKLLQAAREQSHIIAVLSTKLRFTNQSRVTSQAAERARARTPTGRRPWQYPFDDDEPSEPESQPS